MSALAHYFESEGVATTTIALIRQHAEQIQPPRALWVPFELGRPLGPPGDAAFQHRVIAAALTLLDRQDGPVVLEDFPHEGPGESDNPNWQPPDVVSHDDLLTEVGSLAVVYKDSCTQRGYSNVGLTGLPIETIAEFLTRVDSADSMPRPTPRLAPIQVLRFGADDLKAYYAEAAMAGVEMPSSRQLWGWFWRETVAGATVLALRSASINSESESRQGVQRSLVPETWQEDAAVIARTP